MTLPRTLYACCSLTCAPLQNVKRNRRECKELAELAETITTALITATSGIKDEDMDDDMKLNLAEYEW